MVQAFRHFRFKSNYLIFAMTENRIQSNRFETINIVVQPYVGSYLPFSYRYRYICVNYLLVLTPRSSGASTRLPVPPALPQSFRGRGRTIPSRLDLGAPYSLATLPAVDRSRYQLSHSIECHLT